ncbi:MAG: SPFH domain-containing protein [Phycisphaerae bacterium]
MNESKHARARNAAILGILLQVVAFVVLIAIRFVLDSSGAEALAWLVFAGIPIWFASLLLLRQKELADLELHDLEDLQRERAVVGASEGMFDKEGAGGLGYRVAQNRLEWMIRWLVPGFSVFNGLLLLGLAYVLWVAKGIALMGEGEIRLARLPLAITILSVLMLLFFLMSRYAAGLGKIDTWKVLRGCGSYVFGNAVATAGLLICLAVFWYADNPDWEWWYVRIVPILMALLGVETLINAILDIYRPRKAGFEPRAAFDSRLLGLFGEPGGFASSIAEAMNYQFGFEISKSWFYQLVQKYILLLVGAGVLALWLMSTVVIVYPGYHAIVEKYGQQVNPDEPLGPGLHFKPPFPLAVAKFYETGVLQEMLIGYRDIDAEPEEENFVDGQPVVVLWSQERHRGLDHFNFLIYPKETEDATSDRGAPVASTQPTDVDRAPGRQNDSLFDISDTSASVPVNMVRMIISIQYKIDPANLKQFTRQAKSPEETLRNIAWAEVVKYNASHDIDTLLGEARSTYSDDVGRKIANRVKELNLGLDIVYVGMYNVHPETSVAEAYRGVIDATQKRVTAIRQALVAESEALSQVAGDKRRARSLVLAINQLNAADRESEAALLALGAASVDETLADLKRFEQVQPILEDYAVAEERLRRTELAHEMIRQEFEAGIGTDLERKARGETALAEEQENLRRVEAELADALAPLRKNADISDERFHALLTLARAQTRSALWNRYLIDEIPRLEGASAAMLAQGQAERWEMEMRAESIVRRTQIEGEVFATAPHIYKLREYFQTLAEGLRNKRKFFLAFPQDDRNVKVRVVAEDQAGIGIDSALSP